MNFNSQPRPPALTPGCDRPAVSPRTLPSVETAGRSYYNENDPFAAAWLRNLIAEGLIPAGVVDDRSILDVQPSDLKGFTQCHFFAGIGGWPYALQLAGWPHDRSVWTASCPCQPLSVAGKRQGHNDERHLWPAFFSLIPERAPPTIFGEQVASADGLEWLAGIRTDLEGAGYAVGAADLCSAGAGAPHIRQRLYWVADAQVSEHDRIGTEPRGQQGRLADRRALRRLAHTDGRNEGDGRIQRSGQHGFWSQDAIAISCTDGKSRRVPSEPSFQPLAYGVPGRLGQLRAYGNAITPQVGARFIEAFLETFPSLHTKAEDDE